MSRRKLTAEEIDLWHQVVAKAERLHPKAESSRPLPKPKPKPTKTTVARSTPRAERPAPKPPESTPSQPASVSMDRKAFGRLKRGKLVPEARIDLHGMTLDRAHPALTRFILSSQASGRRLVLVITGKGRTSSDHEPFLGNRGILRRNVPIWLGMPPLAQAVLQVTPAHISHGGDGAFYVYLRRAR